MATATESKPGGGTADTRTNSNNNNSNGNSNSNNTTTTNNNNNNNNSRDYYGYLFLDNKTPTKILDALLRAIGQYIVCEIGDKNDHALKPDKLAAFYKAVGGNYDKLFVNAPHESISYIWQVFGCQHTLEPTDNDFEQPSIPALTLKGFVRWESIQILLAPEEHVPFVRYAVKNWHLKNLDTDEVFPRDIPATAFPSEPDPEITAWHAACGDKLKKEATPKDSPRPTFASAADRVSAGFSHVPAFADAGGASRPQRPTGLGSDYFTHTHRSVPFAHVSPGHASGQYTRGGPSLRVSPERGERVRHNTHSSPDERARRRSFSDYPSPNEPPLSAHLHAPRPSTFRRHSHPRRFSEDESQSDNDASPHMSRRSSGHYGSSHRSPKVVPHVAHVAVPAKGPPGGTSPAVPSPPTVQIPNVRTEGGAKLRSDDRASPVTSARRKSAPFEGAKDWAKDKIDRFSGIFPGPTPGDRPRRSPGSNGNISSGNLPVDRSRDSLHGSSSRLHHNLSYDENDTDSEDERERRQQRRRIRERERERDRRDRDRDAVYERERDRLPRRSRDTPDWDDELSRDRARSRKEKDGASARYLRRPDNPRRTSSHADVDRMDRDRHRIYDGDVRDRDRYVDERRRRGGPLDDRDRERGASPVIKGVGGRRYPAEPTWAPESP